MAAHTHRRQVLLFLAAILLPCVALLALGLRLVFQERELAAGRFEDEQRRVTSQLQQELSSRLERTALRQVTALAADPRLSQARAYDDSTVVLVARVSEGELVLPWESNPGARESRTLLGQGRYAEQVRRGERAEFTRGDAPGAVARYRQALELAAHPVQVAHAHSLLARALSRAGRLEEAQAEYRRVTATSPEVVDDNGMPFSLYAARQLLEAEHGDMAVADCLTKMLDAERWPTPASLYLLRDVVHSLLERTSDEELRAYAVNLSGRVSEALSRTEQALSLKEDYPGLGLIPIQASPTSVDDRWMPYGSPVWLVGAPPVVAGEEAAVVAVRAEPILASLETGTSASPDVVGEVRVATGSGPDGEPLGTGFPGLFVSFGTTGGETYTAVGSMRRWFYSAGLLLVIGLTLFGAYLLWRDVRREVQLAETRSRFVSAVSHELKTPLTAIRMFAETLHDDGTLTPDTQGEYLDTIVNESERLTRLLNNVLDFSKIERGQKTYRREPESLAEIVQFTARAMQYPLEQKRFNLRLEIEDDIPPVRADRDAIEQAILNLLANAMKFSGKSREIGLRLRSENGEAIIEVSDQGIGIEPAEVSRIFERFYRVASPENDRIPGTGLGLTLVQHIARAHDGRVAVKSVHGEGSTFSLVIPLIGAEA